MLNLEISIITYYSDNIETHRAVNLKQFQIGIRSTYCTSYFRYIHSIFRLSKLGVTASLYFHDHQFIIFCCYNVQFEMSSSPIPVTNKITFLLKISYGGIFKTEHTTRIGVVPYGYADGFFRCLSNRCALMTKEGPAPQRGKICMDMCMIDLTGKMGWDVGSEVEVFGKQNSINDLAALAGTIPYELTCAVSKRVPRIYIRNGKVVEKELLLRG